jgi:hypothetical protein
MPVVRIFLILTVASTVPYWLWRQATGYGAAVQLACADHCASVEVEHPGQGGRGVVDVEQGTCACALGEPTESPLFDRLDGYVVGTYGPERP